MGATGCESGSSIRLLRFNPLPPRRMGATRADLASPHKRPRFNPLPPRRMGATQDEARRHPQSAGFNPLPPRRMGATFRIFVSTPWNLVSILSHPEGWEPLHHPKSFCDLEFFSRRRGLAPYCPFRTNASSRLDEKIVKGSCLRLNANLPEFSWSLQVRARRATGRHN